VCVCDLQFCLCFCFSFCACLSVLSLFRFNLFVVLSCCLEHVFNLSFVVCWLCVFHRHVGVRVRAALIAAIYNKALSVDLTASKESVGKLNNLISVDVGVSANT
jgi:hypothetical protein